LPKLQLEPGVELAYRLDDFTPPWASAPVVFLLHGKAESGAAWFEWMPRLAGRFRVIRPDLRGFGRSTPMPRDYAWSLDRLAADVLAIADHLGAEQFHLVAADTAGPVALRLAARHPGRVSTLVLLGTGASGAAASGDQQAGWIERVEREGVEAWARATMAARLGTHAEPEVQQGWAKLMGATPAATELGFLAALDGFDATGDLEAVTCPALVVTTDENTLGSLEATTLWQRRIPLSELMVLSGDSHHVAATHALDCAGATADFFKRHTVKEGKKKREGREEKKAARELKRAGKAA